MTTAMDCVTAHMSGVVSPFFSESFENVNFFVGHLLIHRECPRADFVQQPRHWSESDGDAVTLRNTAQKPDYMP